MCNDTNKLKILPDGMAALKKIATIIEFLYNFNPNLLTNLKPIVANNPAQYLELLIASLALLSKLVRV